MATFSPTVSADKLQQLDALYARVKNEVTSRYPQLRDWIRDQQASLSQLKSFGHQLMTSGAIAGSLLLQPELTTQAVQTLQPPQDDHTKMVSTISAEEHQSILDKMKTLVQQPPGHLSTQDELYLEQQLSDILSFEVVAELDNHRLNHSTGIMGGEQHLKRFPTDSLEQHDAFLESGIAPNRGAFGWFTENGQLTPDAIQREKYYFAVQTLYLPTWNQDHAQLKTWYKFRKMIVINPAEEVAVVGVIGDAGPAQWVKKQFGGSPEIIREGKIWSTQSRGRVLLFFVDDPENKVALGPISLSQAEALTKIATQL